MKKLAAFAVFAGMLLIGVSPALATNDNQGGDNGGSAVVSATVGDSTVDVQSTKGLSRVTIVTCDEVLVFDSWEGEQLNAAIPVEGTVEAVFIHSGNNTTDAAQDLLAQLAGDDAVKGNSTGATAYYNADACQPVVPTTQPPVVTTTTEPPVVTTTTQPPVVTTVTEPAPVIVQPSVETAVTPGTDVLGVQVTQPAPAAELPHTGAASSLLASLGALIGLTGLGLLLASAALKRRVQSN